MWLCHGPGPEASWAVNDLENGIRQYDSAYIDRMNILITVHISYYQDVVYVFQHISYQNCLPTFALIYISFSAEAQ